MTSAERDVLDCYFTSYFNAWLDNQNLYTGPKRVVTGFAPRLIGKAASVEGFFDAYPDGLADLDRAQPARLVRVGPERHEDAYQEIDHAIGRWRISAEAALDARERYREPGGRDHLRGAGAGDRGDDAPPGGAIGISMSSVLLEPTFNGRPIRANSSESVRDYGVRERPDDRVPEDARRPRRSHGSRSWRATCTSGPASPGPRAP